jgi:hypothetical protein
MKDRPILLPPRWYHTIPALASRWQCHPDDIFYWFDSGTLTPAALVPKLELPPEAQSGVSPSACIVLDDFRSLSWHYVDGDAVAFIEGVLASFHTDGEGFRIIPLEIKAPLQIARSQLVVTEEQREAMEDKYAAVTVGRPNKAERAATNLVIRALAMKAYPDDLAHHYRMANKLCAALELEGAKVSRQTVAQKLKEALARKTVIDERLTEAKV